MPLASKQLLFIFRRFIINSLFMANYHLVILKKPYLEAILDGSKTVESRFTKTKRIYLGRVLPGDKLFLKESSGPVCATAEAAAVKNFENLTPEIILKLKKRYNSYIRGSNEYWQDRADCKFGFLVWLKNAQPTRPVRIHKKDWRGWVVLTEQQNFGLLKNQML